MSESTIAMETLNCEHEGAGDRLVYDINYAIKVEKYDRVIVGSLS